MKWISKARSSHRSWQADAVKQAPVPWFRTQAIKLGIAEHDEPHHAFAERLLEVIERAPVIPDARERDGEIVRRDVLKPRALGQFGKKRQCASIIASACSRVTKWCDPQGCRPPQRNGVLQRLDGALRLV